MESRFNLEGAMGSNGEVFNVSDYDVDDFTVESDPDFDPSVTGAQPDRASRFEQDTIMMLGNGTARRVVEGTIDAYVSWYLPVIGVVIGLAVVMSMYCWRRQRNRTAVTARAPTPDQSDQEYQEERIVETVIEPPSLGARRKEHLGPLHDPMGQLEATPTMEDIKHLTECKQKIGWLKQAADHGIDLGGGAVIGLSKELERSLKQAVDSGLDNLEFRQQWVEKWLELQLSAKQRIIHGTAPVDSTAELEDNETDLGPENRREPGSRRN